MWRNKYVLGIMTFFSILVLAACSKSDGTVAEGEKEALQQKASDQNIEEDEQDTNKVEKQIEIESAATEETKTSFAPNDQGDMEVWFDGEIKIDNKSAHVKGTTNLLPNSRVQLRFKWDQGALLGSDVQTSVDENGQFELDTEFADNLDGVLHAEVTFNPNYQSPEIVKHYGDQLAGPFVRLYTDANRTVTKATFKQTVILNNTVQTFSIIEPVWEKPDDYGEPTVWLEPKIEEIDEFIHLKIKSNLIEGTFVQIKSDVPNYMTNAFDGSGYTDPDGTIEIYIKHPKQTEKMKDLKDFAVDVIMNPSDIRNGPHVTDVYGEAGEKLAGDLIKAEKEKQVMENKIKITVQ